MDFDAIFEKVTPQDADLFTLGDGVGRDKSYASAADFPVSTACGSGWLNVNTLAVCM